MYNLNETKFINMTFDLNEIKYRYPLHYYVWMDDKVGLKKHLKQQSKVCLLFFFNLFIYNLILN